MILNGHLVVATHQAAMTESKLSLKLLLRRVQNKECTDMIKRFVDLECFKNDQKILHFQSKSGEISAIADSSLPYWLTSSLREQIISTDRKRKKNKNKTTNHKNTAECRQNSALVSCFIKHVYQTRILKNIHAYPHIDNIYA